jgi:N-acetylglucosamine-6-sulfatase
VPLFVRGPGVPAGSKVEKLALNTDFASAFADLAGVEFSADGRSLAPLLRGEDPSWRSAILLEVPTKEASEEEGDKGGDEARKAVGYEAIRTETHKYVEYANGERELYDLESDPYELDSVHESADPSLVEDLKATLDVLRSCANTGCREAEEAQ